MILQCDLTSQCSFSDVERDLLSVPPIDLVVWALSIQLNTPPLSFNHQLV